MVLGRRQRSVLLQIVERFIASGEPVASRHVASSAKIGLSSASVRSVMAELEAKGYVTRCHHSAGSEPTDQAFRLFVDGMPARLRLSPNLRRTLHERLSAMRRELAEDLGWVARLVAEVTNEAGVAVRPLGERAEVAAVSLLPLAQGQVLGVIVSAAGGIEKRVLKTTSSLTADELQSITNQLNHHFRGRAMDQIRGSLADSLDVATVELVHSLDSPSFEMAKELFASSPDGSEVQVAGTENLLMSQDFSEVDRVRSLVSLLQDRQRLVDEWRRLFVTDRTQVIIGKESDATASGRLGMVAALFFRGGRRVGAVGVVGPRRMDYLRIVPVVEYVGNSLTQMLDGGGALNG